MKLVFKPIAGHVGRTNAFALHTENGEYLPQQVKATMITEVDRITRIIVEFNVDGETVTVEGFK